jgi:4'-phosphopantetheinyl transferase EntD
MFPNIRRIIRVKGIDPPRTHFSAVPSEVLPKGVVSAASRTDLDIHLFPEEESSIGRAVEKRRREFTTGRACARAALGLLGIPPQPIPGGPGGEPRWPAGIVGSITHCKGYRACAVAPETDLATIGIDAEPDEPLPAGVLAAIALPRERALVAELAAEAPEVNWDRLLFSIKEAIYKAWFPLTGLPLGFDDASVDIEPSSGAFEARIPKGAALPDSSLGELSGRWVARDGLLLASAAHPAHA